MTSVAFAIDQRLEFLPRRLLRAGHLPRAHLLLARADLHADFASAVTASAIAAASSRSIHVPLASFTYGSSLWCNRSQSASVRLRVSSSHSACTLNQSMPVD